ncbi:MAG: UDP-N-acetylglucosamine 1-carboxyvinyltransferase [Clostridia bacterium]|nr:UDP-N-acetylglucosamine 1-carboxyvinyltransferase [Clostridia bacterium]
MKKVLIRGGAKLSGRINVQGAKNSVLPILSAAILTDEKCVIKNCPDLTDVHNTINILNYLGHNSCIKNNILTVNHCNSSNNDIPDIMMRKMRSSILFLGALLNKYGYAKITLPGGCELGLRPIDLHLKAFEQLGVTVNEHCGYYECICKKIIGKDIYLDFPSVGATENIMILACRCCGDTVIHNAAKEPEIVDLQKFLNCMGTKIYGAGTDTIHIKGVEILHGVDYTIMPDRIVASTYLVAAAITNGEVIIENACADDIISVISVLSNCGFNFECGDKTIKLISNNKIKPIDLIRTMPYPGFPTDVQSIITSLLSLADGTSVICENLFENRFKHVYELNRMGADINVIERNAIIRGVKHLYGANVTASDLRGAAGLIVAGLAAKGKTTVDGIEYLERGYEGFVENLNKLGADIIYIS